MSGEKYYEHCDVDPIAFRRDMIEISIRENENTRASPLETNTIKPPKNGTSLKRNSEKSTPRSQILK